MRLKLLPPVLSAALVAGGLALVTTTPSHAAPLKLYFHSAAGSYQDDYLASPAGFGSGAPAGSTLDTKPPTKTDDAIAVAFTLFGWSSEPLSPTFTFPYSGDITALCLDFWVQSTPNPETGALVTYTAVNAAFPAGDLFETADVEDYDGELIRVTKLVKPDGVAKITVAKDSEFTINGDIFNPDWAMYYDSASHPSSVTVNPTDCKATPVVVPSGGASPTRGGSSSPTPGGSSSPTPGGSSTPSPGGSGSPTATPSATATPTPSPTTPPPPAQETGLDYTGATAGRYSDSPVVSAKVTLPDGTGVPSGSVEFAVGSDKVTLPVDASGVASGRLPLRTSRPGQYVMTVRYVANAAYLGSGEQVPFTVQRMGTRCAITRSTSGGNYLVTGSLRDALGRVLAGQMLTFSYDGRAFRSLRTDRNGRAQVSVTARPGTYTVSLPGTSHYTGCSASFEA